MKHPSFASAHIHVSIYTHFQRSGNRFGSLSHSEKGLWGSGVIYLFFIFKSITTPFWKQNKVYWRRSGISNLFWAQLREGGTVFQRRNTNIQDSAGEKWNQSVLK